MLLSASQHCRSFSFVSDGDSGIGYATAFFTFAFLIIPRIAVANKQTGIHSFAVEVGTFIDCRVSQFA